MHGVSQSGNNLKGMAQSQHPSVEEAECEDELYRDSQVTERSY